MAIDNGTIYTSIRVRLDQLDTDLAAYNQRLTQLEKSSQTSFGKINAGAVVAFAAIGAAIKATLSAFTQFQQSMANTASVAGATEEEFKALEKAAIDAGESTRFTASQAADAMYYLASAGYDATQSIAALDGVLLLAGSTGSDLAFTAETMASTLSQYNLAADQAARISNVFAATISGSQATMEKLATSLKYVGPVMSAFGISIEETAGTLAILYNNGFAASQAGTALRSALGDLANAASPANAKLQELGVSFDEINPQTNKWSDVVDVLSKKVTNASDIMTVFGDRAGPALIKLLEAGKAKVDEYTASVTGTAKAAEMYATQNDTLAGSIDFMKSALESAMIKTGKEFEPILRGIVDTITLLIKGFNALPGPMKIAVGIMATLTAGLLGLGVVIPLVQGALTAFGASTGPIFAVIAGISVLVGAITAISQAMEADKVDRYSKAYASLAQELDLTDKELVKLVDTAKSVDYSVNAFGRLRKELGLTNKELKDFILVSRDMGVSAESIAKAGTAFNLNAADINAINGRLREQLMLVESEYVSIDDVIKNIARDLGLSESQVAKIVSLNEDVDDSLKSQAKQILTNHEAIMKAYEDQFTRYAYIEAEKSGKGYLASKQAAALKAQELADAEAEARKAKQILDLGKLRAETDKQKLILKTKLGKELLTEQQYEQEMVKLYEKVADSVLTINNGVDEGNDQLATALAYLKEHGVEYNKSGTAVDEWKGKLEDLDKTTLESIEDQRKLALEGVAAGSELEQAINDYYDRLKDDEANQQFLDNIKGVASTVKEVLGSLMSAYSDYLKGLTDQQLEAIDEQEQAELEAAGLAGKTEVEKAEEKLRLAKETGDAEAILEAQNELKKAQIAEKYEKQRAEVKYKAAVDEWNNKWIMSLVDTASAVVEALPNVPLSIAAGITGGINTGVILANPPKPPSFATGGIVAPSGSGTLINVAENKAPEMMLNGGAEGEPYMDVFAFRIASIVAKSIRFPEQINGNLYIGETEIRQAIFKIMHDGAENNEFTMNKQVVR